MAIATRSITRLTILLLLICTMQFHSYGQDLIKNTQAGIERKSEAKAPNRIANWLKKEKSQFTPSAFALFDFEKNAPTTRYQEEVATAVYLTLDQDQLTKLLRTAPERLSFEVPVDNRKAFQLELAKVDNVSDDFVLKTSDGKTITQQEIGGIFYRGIVQGDQRSIAALSIFPDHLQLVIADRSDNYVLARLPYDKSAVHDYVLYAEKDLVAREKPNCLAETTTQNIRGIPFRNQQHAEKLAEERSLGVYIECDFSLFQAVGGGAINTAQYAQAVFNVSATIFQNEGITKEVSEIFVWTEEDSFVDLNFTSAVLEGFILSKARTSFPGNYAHILTARFGRSGIAGAFDCTVPFALTSFILDLAGDFPTPSIDVSIFAHEMGHNVGSLHTHGCYWNSDIYGIGTQIDDCGNANRLENGSSPEGRFCIQNAFQPIIPAEGGTIMSYCDQSSILIPYPGTNFELGFGAQPGDVIRMHYNDPPKGCTTLDAPQANLNCTTVGRVFFSGDSLILQGIRVENQGDIPVEDSNIGIYLSEDPFIYPSSLRSPLDIRDTDSLIAVVPIAALEVDSSTQVDAVIDLNNPDLISGQYFIGAYANYDRKIDEGNLGDNGIASGLETLTLETTLSCLSAGSIEVDSTIVTISDIAIANTGRYTTAPTNIGIVLSEDSILNPFADEFITSIFIPALAPNDSIMLNQTIDLVDYSIPPGAYFIGTTIDPFGQLLDGTVDPNSTCAVELVPYRVDTLEQLCVDEIYTASSGTLTDGSGNANAQFGTFCTQTITPDIGGRIALNFTELDLLTARDFVVFREGNRQIGAFTGDVLPDSTVTAQNSLQILYISSNASAGWSADYEVVQPNFDVELDMTASTSLPRPLQKVDYTFTVRNAGFRLLRSIVVQHDFAGGKLRLAEGSTPDAFSGTYDNTTGTWQLPLLPAGRSSTLTLQMVSTASDFDLFAQVTSMRQEDGDSTPNNGVCCMEQEDDEAVFSPNLLEPEESLESRSTKITMPNFVIEGIYPNPVQEEATIIFFTETPNINLKVQDVNGRLVHQEQWITAAGVNYKRLDMKAWRTGVYFLSINSGAPARVVKVE